MKLQTLIEANRIASELKRWKDIYTRLECGDSFYQMIFKADKNKTMDSEYQYMIYDEPTINCFKHFVDTQIKKYEDELERI